MKTEWSKTILKTQRVFIIPKLAPRHSTYDIQHNDTRHKWLLSGTQHNDTVIILNVVVLSVIMLNVVAPPKLPFTWRHLLVNLHFFNIGLD
jgi:hypothetical protein